MELKENNVEFISGDPYITCSFSSLKFINKMKKYHEKHKDAFVYFKENADGSICCKLPSKWLKISPPKQMSEEAREKAAERFRQMHEDGRI